MSLRDQFYAYQIPFVQKIQTNMLDHESTLFSISQLGDPGYAFTVLFPVISSYDPRVGINILVAISTSEWLNAILKWLLIEDRPYWWVRETSMYNDNNRPILRQTPITCETGPGSPSGHMMCSAALFYVIVRHMIDRYQVRMRSESSKKSASFCMWMVYLGTLVVLAISRLFVATHFPHQCILGAIIGILLGHYLTNADKLLTKFWNEGSRLRLLIVAVYFVLIPTGLYWIQKSAGQDPQWSVKLAFKWCENPDNIHVSTTPLYCLVRDAGAVLGVVFLAPIIKRWTSPTSTLVRAAGTFIASAAIQAAHQLAPKESPAAFYATMYLLHAAQVFLLLAVVPAVATVRNKIKKH